MSGLYPLSLSMCTRLLDDRRSQLGMNSGAGEGHHPCSGRIFLSRSLENITIWGEYHNHMEGSLERGKRKGKGKGYGWERGDD